MSSNNEHEGRWQVVGSRYYPQNGSWRVLFCRWTPDGFEFAEQSVDPDRLTERKGEVLRN